MFYVMLYYHQFCCNFKAELKPKTFLVQFFKYYYSKN